MIVWMLWSVIFAALTGVAAVSLERVAGLFAVPRRFVWMAAILVCALSPIVFATYRANTSTPTLVPARAAKASARGTVSVIDASSPVTRTVRRVAVRSATADVWAVRLWMVLSLVVAATFALATRTLRRRQAVWHEAQLGLCRALVAPDAGPAIVGFTRPRIVVPQWALTLEQRTQDMMLRHELEHIRAGDPLTLLGAGVLLVVLPWNPAIWWMVRQLRLAMELDCDARVIRAIGGARESHDYGLVLLAVGERYTTPLPFAAPFAGARPFLERRINVMTMLRPRRPMLAAVPLMAIALVAMTAATTAPRPGSLASIAKARGHQDYPTREMLAAMVGENLPAIASGAQKADYVVVVLDANNNFVRAIPGQGNSMIAAGSDPLTTREARAARSVARGAASAGPSAGRGGAGGGAGAGFTSGTAPRASSPVLHPSYSTGTATMSRGPDGTYVRPPMNNAPGLHKIGASGDGDDSGIDGVRGSQVTSIEIFSFTEGQVAPARISLVVATLAPAASH
jgi:beta-lactamase regulating signal transducer with metallopeptidase domain